MGMVEGLSVSEMGEQPEIKGESIVDDVTARVVNISHGGARDVRADTVTMRQAGVRSVTADQVNLRQVGAGRVEAAQLEMTQGCVGLTRTQNASLHTSMSSILIADGNVKMDQSGTQVLLAKGDVTMEQSGALILMSRSVKAEHSGATFLIAKEVQGDIKATFGPRESLIFGTVAGVVAGLTLAAFRMFRK
jgi:hypothetical protein